MPFSLHHICLTVQNTDESIAWYTNNLGFKVIHRYQRHGMEITHLKRDSIRIEFFCYGENTKSLPNYRKELMNDLHVVGTKHLCIQVEKLQQVLEDLKERGIEPIRPIDTAGFGGIYTFIKDCNGILIELYQA